MSTKIADASQLAEIAKLVQQSGAAGGEKVRSLLAPVLSSAVSTSDVVKLKSLDAFRTLKDKIVGGLSDPKTRPMYAAILGAAGGGAAGVAAEALGNRPRKRYLNSLLGGAAAGGLIGGAGGYASAELPGALSRARNDIPFMEAAGKGDAAQQLREIMSSDLSPVEKLQALQQLKASESSSMAGDLMKSMPATMAAGAGVAAKSSWDHAGPKNWTRMAGDRLHTYTPNKPSMDISHVARVLSEDNPVAGDSKKRFRWLMQRHTGELKDFMANPSAKGKYLNQLNDIQRNSAFNRAMELAGESAKKSPPRRMTFRGGLPAMGAGLAIDGVLNATGMNPVPWMSDRISEGVSAITPSWLSGS